jgi:hypothetical protein
MLIKVASTPLTRDVVIECKPALRAQGFISNCGAPPSPWRSGLPACTGVVAIPRMSPMKRVYSMRVI